MKKGIRLFLLILGAVIIVVLALLLLATKVPPDQPETIQSIQSQIPFPVQTVISTPPVEQSKKPVSTTPNLYEDSMCENEAKSFFDVKNLGSNAAYQSHFNIAEQRCLVLIADGTSTNDFNAVLWDAYDGTKLAQFVTPYEAFQGWCLINNTYGCTINQFDFFVQTEMAN